MNRLGLARDIVDRAVYQRAVAHLRKRNVILPTLSELAMPTTMRAEAAEAAARLDPDEAHPRNLFRVHWYNGSDRRRRVTVPDYVVLPESLTGVPSPILVAFGNRFPLIRAHKVLAAYGCLVPRLVSGQFDPTVHQAVWPSTGNYCRGGVAISRLLGCHGVAVLPQGMSAERFEWLEQWVTDPADIVRTPGTESNVKEIYDKCAELEADRTNIIFNQFCEFGNYLVHYHCTGQALERVFADYTGRNPGVRLAGFSSATGSAGTIGAGDYLKERHGAQIVAAEALECPTMLENGYGEHNIQGIGDKHIPLIHNIMNTDVVCAISDHSTDALSVVFASEAGRAYLIEERGVPESLVYALDNFGLSSICNVLAAVNLAKTQGLGPKDALITVATDGAELYRSEYAKAVAKHFGGKVDRDAVAKAYARHMLGAAGEHTLVLTDSDRRRIFNLGYFTWVEQQGVPLAEFAMRRSQSFWRDLHPLIPAWDAMIAAMNAEIGAR